MRKNVASQVIAAQLVSSTDGSNVTSGTTTVYVTGDGGTQASGGTATHEGQGCWTFLPSQANTNYNHVAFTFVNTSAISTTVQVYPVSYDPTDAVRLGLPALPNAAAGAAGGLPTDSAGKTSFNDIAATAIVSSGAITTSGGAVSTVSTVTDGAKAANLATVDTVVDAIKVKTDFLPSATAGAAGGVFIAGTNAATTITTGLTTTFTGNLTGSVGSVTGAVGSVAGNVDGSVASVTGAVGSVTGAVGSVTGAVGSVAGNVDGNVTGSVGSLAAQAKADVNAEVVDTLATDTYAELADVPAATVSLADKLAWLFMLARNKVTQDATTQTLRNDADSADIGTSTVSDSAGTFTRGEWTDSP